METLKAYIETHRDTIVDTFTKTFYTDNLSPERKLEIIDWTYKEALHTNLDYYQPQNWLPERLAPIWNKNYRLFPFDSPYTFGVPKIIREKGQILLTPAEIAHWKECAEEKKQRQQYEAWKKKKAQEEAELARSIEITPEQALDDIFSTKKSFPTNIVSGAAIWSLWLCLTLVFSLNLLWVILPICAALALWARAKFAHQKEEKRVNHIKHILLTPQEDLNREFEQKEEISLAKRGKGDKAFVELVDGRVCTLKNGRPGYYHLG